MVLEGTIELLERNRKRNDNITYGILGSILATAMIADGWLFYDTQRAFKNLEADLKSKTTTSVKSPETNYQEKKILEDMRRDDGILNEKIREFNENLQRQGKGYNAFPLPPPPDYGVKKSEPKYFIGPIQPYSGEPPVKQIPPFTGKTPVKPLE